MLLICPQEPEVGTNEQQTEFSFTQPLQPPVQMPQMPMQQAPGQMPQMPMQQPQMAYATTTNAYATTTNAYAAIASGSCFTVKKNGTTLD